MAQGSLVDAVQRLSFCRDLPSVMEVLRDSARSLTGADGVTVVIREGDLCHYADENAIAPLWKGKRFPMSACISGWAMLNKEQVAIRDIYQDPRIPHDAYRPTFVKSLAMTPIRTSDPIGAIGAYWAKERSPTAYELTTLQALGDAASVAFENVRLIQSLTDANRLKDEFILMLAHELRNPLGPVRYAAHLLRARAGQDAAVTQAHDVIERQMTHMERLLGDLLDVARFTRGSVELRTERMDLARALRDVCSDATPGMMAGNVLLDTRIPETPVWISGDATRIAQAVGNVLDNARKFTPSGGSITVTLERAPSGAVLRVAGTGGGPALGLSVARAIFEQHGGSMSAASEGPGRGMEITITVPALAEPAAIDGQPTPARTVKGYHVLIVEDNVDAAMSLRMILELTGYAVTLAHSGPDGVAAAKSVRPQLVICDIGLPGFDGFTVAQQLRSDPETRNARLIAVTGYGSDNDHERAARAGFDVHLVKPVAPDRLLGHLIS